MARATQNLLLISSVLVLALAFPSATAEGYEKHAPAYSSPATVPKPYAAPKVVPDVVVEGIVYCQSCNYSGTWNLDEAKPITGARISVICRNYRGRISYYKAFSTSDEGYFYARLDGFAIKHQYLDHPLQSCAVKLVSSPQDSCDVFTNINYGIKGAPLRYEQKKVVRDNYEAVIYAAGPLAFRPEHCAPKEY